MNITTYSPKYIFHLIRSKLPKNKILRIIVSFLLLCMCFYLLPLILGWSLISIILRKTSSKTGYSLVAIVLILTLCFSYIWGYSFIDTSKNSPVDSSTLNTNIAGNTVLTRTKTAEVSITVIPTEAGTKTMATTTHVSVPTTPIAHTSLYTSSLHISITQSAGQVGQGNYATEGITTTVGAYCTIQVEYKTGPSQAQGLTPQTTNKIGSVIWTWKIGTRTTPGSWPININCSLNGSYDEISDNIIVNSQ